MYTLTLLPSPRRLPPPLHHILIAYEGNQLHYVTRRPGIVIVEDILDYYGETFNVPLELWNSKTKVRVEQLLLRFHHTFFGIVDR